MKKLVIQIFAVCFVAAIFFTTLGFKMKGLIVDKTSAQAEIKESLTLFHYSKPVSKYDILGTVKVPVICSDRSDERVKHLIDRSKKDFPSGEALIINEAFGKAEVIKFKD